MPRIRTGPNRYWSKEDKLKIISEVMQGKSISEVSKAYDISTGMLTNWIRSYNEHGEAALENRRKPGNPMAVYARKKELTEIERLHYENMKLKIENERLKKGYMVKGDGSVVIFKK